MKNKKLIKNWYFAKQNTDFDIAFKASMLFEKFLQEINKEENLKDYYENNKKDFDLGNVDYRIFSIAKLYGLITLKKQKIKIGENFHGTYNLTNSFLALKNSLEDYENYNVLKSEQLLKVKVETIIEKNREKYNKDYFNFPIIFTYKVLKILFDEYKIDGINIDYWHYFIATNFDYKSHEKIALEIFKATQEKILLDNYTLKYIKDNNRFGSLFKNNISLFEISINFIKINKKFFEKMDSLTSYFEKLDIHILEEDDSKYINFLQNIQNFNINISNTKKLHNVKTYDVNFTEKYRDDHKLECEISESDKKRLKVNKTKAKDSIRRADFKCENNENHLTFLDKNGNQYQESHHLVPVKFWKKIKKEFDVNIDTFENLISLCPTCHRQIHLGKKFYREQIIENLFKKRIDKFRKIGLEISLFFLKNLYK